MIQDDPPCGQRANHRKVRRNSENSAVKTPQLKSTIGVSSLFSLAPVYVVSKHDIDTSVTLKTILTRSFNPEVPGGNSSMSSHCCLMFRKIKHDQKNHARTCMTLGK